MFRQSPGRNQRSKGVKVKHVLQICVLLAVCFWLIYQVKHSHDKKKEFDETNGKISLTKGSNPEVFVLGRKDLEGRAAKGTLKNEKLDEEAEEDEIAGGEVSKHEEEELDEVKRMEEKEDQEREDIDDEVEEHDQDKFDVEIDHEDNLLDVEKEKEEDSQKEIEYKENQLGNENSLEDHDNDHNAKSTHEAREEHYKADDASSAVTHDGTEIENGNSDNIKQQSEISILGQANQLNDTEDLRHTSQDTTVLELGEGDMIGNHSSFNTTAIPENISEGTLKAKENGTSNFTLISETADRQDQKDNSTEINRESNGLPSQNERERTPTLNESQNAIAEGTTVTQNSTVEFSNSGEDTNLQTNASEQVNNSSITSYNNSTFPTKELNSEASSGDSLNYPTNPVALVSKDADSSNNLTNSEGFGSGDNANSNITAKAEDMKENTIAIQEVKSGGSDPTDKLEGSSDHTKTDNVEEAQNDHIDLNDSSMPLE